MGTKIHKIHLRKKLDRHPQKSPPKKNGPKQNSQERGHSASITAKSTTVIWRLHRSALHLPVTLALLKRGVGVGEWHPRSPYHWKQPLKGCRYTWNFLVGFVVWLKIWWIILLPCIVWKLKYIEILECVFYGGRIFELWWIKNRS